MPERVPISADLDVSKDGHLPDLAETQAQLSTSRRETQDLKEALKAAGAREQMLAYELQHRVQNKLAMLRSIYGRTLENGASQEEFAEHFEGRLSAIARYQAELAGVSSGGIELADMIREELLAVQCLEGSSCMIAWLPVRLRQKWCELMGLAIHELTTNAVKFGAVCHRGTLAVEWSLTDAPATLHFRWKEAGVPLLSAAPRPHGFGQDLIEEALPYQLGATTSFEFRPGGLDCCITLPLPASDDSSKAASIAAQASLPS